MCKYHGVTNNAGLIRLMHDSDKNPRKYRDQATKLIPLLWKPELCHQHIYLDGDNCTHCVESKVGSNASHHLCIFKMMHNGHEWRSRWMARVSTDTPHSQNIGHDGRHVIWMLDIWLDNDIELFNEVIGHQQPNRIPPNIPNVPKRRNIPFWVDTD